MTVRNKFLLFIIIILLLGAGVWSLVYFRTPAQNIIQGEKADETPPYGNCSTALPGSPSTENTREQACVLKITGSSRRLSQKQQTSMGKWREQVADMARQRPEEIKLNGPPNRRAVSITFDDGPDLEITPQILAILNREGVKATFFVTGQQTRRYPLQVQTIKDSGQLVLSHTYAHRQLDHLSQEAVNNEVLLADEAIQNAIGMVPVGVRPPYGAINDKVVDLLEARGKLTILWSIDTLDWAGDEAPIVAGNVLDNVRPGDIILMHSISGRANTVKALPVIIKGLREKGYEMVRVDELLNRKL